MNSQKYIGFPKSFFDFPWLLRVAKRLNALFNVQVVDEKGVPVGEVVFTEGNTAIKIKRSAANGETIPVWI